MSKEERYVEHTAAWELPNCYSVTKSNYNLADIETKYMPIQTEVICDDKDKIIADLETKLAEEKEYTQQYRKECAKIQTDYYKTKQQLAESEKAKESYRLQNEHHHLQLLQFYSRLGVEAFGADIHEKALETLMIMKDQLAEKEKEIESYKHFKITIGTMENNQVDISSTTYTDQDKISFAVEQLEKARKLIDELLDNCGDKQYKVWEVFDSQIKQLKEGK